MSISLSPTVDIRVSIHQGTHKNDPGGGSISHFSFTQFKTSQFMSMSMETRSLIRLLLLVSHQSRRGAIENAWMVLSCDYLSWVGEAVRSQ